MVLSVILLATGFVAYGKLLRARAISDQRTFMESRRSLINVIELKKWGYFPDDINPTEIRVNVVVPPARQVCGQRDRDANRPIRFFYKRFRVDQRTREPKAGYQRRDVHVRVPLKDPGGGARE
jgi:hypothetical protein